MLHGIWEWGIFETHEDFTFEELQEAFYELIDDFKVLGLKNKEPRKQKLVLINENIDFQKEKESFLKEKKCLLEENKFLKKEVEKLKPIVKRFTLSFEKLNILLNNQKLVYNKISLGFNFLKKEKLLKNIFEKLI